jgi:hypothetical protein
LAEDFPEEEDFPVHFKMEVKMYENLIRECKEELKDNLVSIIKYGTEGEPNNILLVTKQLKFNDLEKLKPIILTFSKKSKVVPILFTESGLKDSNDVFPLEILDMIYPHELLHGIDVLNNVELDKKHVRTQIEFELRSKLIHLRENYIGIKRPNDIKLLLKSAVPTLMPLLYGLLFMKNIKPPSDLDSLYLNVEKNYDVDMEVFRKIREGAIKKQDLTLFVKELINLLEKLINIVDKIEF